MNDWVAASQLIQNAGVAIAALVGSYLAWKNLRPTSSQAEAARIQADLARRAHVAELFHRSVADLGSERRVTRLGAIYTLGYIAREYRDLSWPATEVLAMHLREDYRPEADETPPIEVHEIMNILKADPDRREPRDAS